MTGYDSRRYARLNRWDPSHLEKVERLMGPTPGERMLEVGCGVGHLTRRLAERGIDVVGIDANPNASEIAGSDRVQTMRAESLTFPDDSFDAIVSVHAIEHIPKLDAALAEMGRVLRPGGRVLFIYPAEPIMGLYAIPTSVLLHRNPLMARRVHCQKLWPSRVRRMVAALGWSETHHEFNLLKSPQFVSCFTAALEPSPGRSLVRRAASVKMTPHCLTRRSIECLAPSFWTRVFCWPTPMPCFDSTSTRSSFPS